MSEGSPPRFRFDRVVPPGDNRQRMVCRDCGWIHYQNPKIIVGAVCEWERSLLLCRRAIEPRRDFWTFPAGFLEEHESAEAGAVREAQEEACAEIAIEGLLGIYSVPRISQVQLLYRARLVDPRVAAGEESLEVALFEVGQIPWETLAFPSVRWALERFLEVRNAAAFTAFLYSDPGVSGL